MIAYGRFLFKGEINEGYFDVQNEVIIFDGERIPIKAVRFLPPVKPSKLICVGVNYRDHAEEFGKDVPDEPIIFMKPDTAVIGDGDAIILPNMSERVDYEGELAVVLAKKCKNVSYDDAKDYILGYTCFNDVTARDLQMKDGQWTRGKSFDTFAPLGPYVVSNLDPRNLEIKTYLNGRVVQASNTSNMVFDAFRLLEFVSSIMTLKRGDVIATGTPSGVGPLRDGDVVEVHIEGIGVLRNYAINMK
ncbi:2-keto-4-pentenoate hydratase/2-oxohepta-3-ene-1,7-dioic acid hydratase (catechol pathway) [Archaeoglobus sulfaticallidus PM70-1]|uniref:2-keto-4-pentenoate hydratase/2-oxohepta-3-ene-1,7-dioic acid hydratase (Catechol pathway) n=1 Tax=Archaeoglobus sulfaticallidus PM70-1 TaxID=387631 RepID=N0BEJ8_9EURY|nr:fumarylacetoacetate hydrolase family protein [Archaeoglobus sulfaticallidus]AGK60697.1 2-keto-4-pentenoate hydratase/2-oxohepta-3-ene-1,7-dioic acid hydratase (catechol pathway) [Archaeoglobus sulfaticallidus PM70-1]